MVEIHPLPHPHPLHLCIPKKTEISINRIHTILHGIALLALFYYRITTLSQLIISPTPHLLPYLIIFVSEVVLSFLWLVHRPSKWRPLTRATYPDNLPKDDAELPPVDIFVCTVDPSKEPSLDVMNTVISAMALDYPPDKIAVYLSDDGGAPLTLAAMKEAWRFSVVWIPFCKKYRVINRCPDAYFSGADKSSGEVASDEFLADRKVIEDKYGEFKERLDANKETLGTSVSGDHPPIVKIINDATDNNSRSPDSNQKGMPLLVYVAREKRPSHPHHFKAGAINVLLRVSGVISNAPYFVVLDCDHYCNDTSAARQAMCFFFDPEISPKLAWVQYPQHFHNISPHDIYDGNLFYYWREWEGLDGIRGPTITGCNFFMRREAIYGIDEVPKDADLSLLRKYFGSSHELIKSTYRSYKPSISRDEGKVSDELQKEIQLVASCTYDDGTEWGNEVGSGYNSVVEDALNSLKLHRKGWISVWYDPKRPCFLGTCTTNLNDMLVQQTRWALGLLLLGVSRNSPAINLSSKMPIFQSMSYAGLTLDPLYVIPFYGLAIVPQLCLLHGVSLYPKVGDPFFFVFAFIFISSQLKHVQEVVSYGSPFITALYDLRVWMMKCGACYLYATLNAVLDRLGLQEANFSITSKVIDEEETKRYQDGVYDFRTSPQLLAPMCSLYIVNLVAFLVASVRIFEGEWGREMFAQAAIPWFGVTVNYHLLDGMLMRKDKGRISPAVTMLSVVICASILFLGSLFMFV
ncbi:cellulose synthase-like protein G3 [Andrographis paniculata]|uniref:cellulose synthase-like protein G3 n=1 Tax=Andrographis paniculata TaxID=175694 RepID=UPI0021E73F01|nr:cellulose synthase-like protein G3 [Andrographis paniculata]